MDSFLDRVHDPLLFLNNDKSDLDAFLMNTSADMAHMAEEMHINVSDVKMENSLDLDSLEGNGHLGDMHWLHNSSLSTLAHLDNDDTSDSTNVISVTPQSVLPVQTTQDENTDNHLSFESENGASMRLLANSSPHDSAEAGAHAIQQTPVYKPQSIRQEPQTIRILSVQGRYNRSPSKTKNLLITSSKDSPHKGQTFVLSAVDGTFPEGLTISANLPIHTNTSGSQFVRASPQEVHTFKADKKNNRVVLNPGHNLLSPSQASPVLLGRLQTGVQPQVHHQVYLKCTIPSTTTPLQQSEHATVTSTTNSEEKVYPKPVFSYSCLIALALKNSKNGNLPVSEIYSFMCENFPYFKTAPDGWKNSVRHNLSLNKCFAKVDNPKMSQGAKKGCLWALNPAKVLKMEDEISKWSKKDPAGLLTSMAYPENLEAIEKGQAGLHYSKKKSPDCSPCTPIQAEATTSETSELVHEQKPDFSQIRIEKYHPNIPFEKTELKHSIKVEHSSEFYRDSSQAMKQELPSSPSRSHTGFKMEPSDFSYLEIPSSFSNDALTDIVLQNSVWDDDLENNIDIDLICNSSSSCIPSPPTHSPVMFRLSPNAVLLPNSSGSKKPT